MCSIMVRPRSPVSLSHARSSYSYQHYVKTVRGECQTNVSAIIHAVRTKNAARLFVCYHTRSWFRHYSYAVRMQNVRRLLLCYPTQKVVPRPLSLSCEKFRRVRDPTVSAPYIGVYVRMNLTESIVSFASKVVLIICYSLRATIPPNDSITGMPRRWQPSLSSSNDVNTPIRDVKRS